MNAKETMQALLDGKTLRYNRNGMDVRYKLDDAGNLLQTHGCSYVVLRSWTLADLEVYEGYPLTFEQALREMLDGKVVESQRCNNPTRFHEGRFEYLCDDTWFFTDIQKFEQKSKWKVVE